MGSMPRIDPQLHGHSDGMDGWHVARKPYGQGGGLGMANGDVDLSVDLSIYSVAPPKENVQWFK